jgi:hypothetical protein
MASGDNDAMDELFVPEPISGGILLSYACTSRCRHCMYACSPQWPADWISESAADRILRQLAATIQGSPLGPARVGINYGLHFTGGEPFLNFDLLLALTQRAQALHIPSTFVETNCCWCIDDATTRRQLAQLQQAGLHGILISVNPFILEYVPFERTERAVRISEAVFGGNVMIYQEVFYQQFQRLRLTGILPFDTYLRLAGASSLSHAELLVRGRACYALRSYYATYPATRFFGRSSRAELTRPWHIHIDNYGNYLLGYCGGLSLGDADRLAAMRRIRLEATPILAALAADLQTLYALAVRDFGYRDLVAGYVSKCHLCVDIRQHIAQQTEAFTELRPPAFYQQLTAPG